MHVRVRLFASLRETVGVDEVRLELPAGATAEDAWTRLCTDHPALAARRGSLSAAVNRRYARFSDPLPEDAEIAFVPPVSGG
jgi:molybdopterin converting factor subunit 1